MSQRANPNPALGPSRAAPDFPLPADAEWLLTDGRGGYACGAVDDRARRRYHGLWVARPPGAARRCLLVAGLDEAVVGAAGPVSMLHARWAALSTAVPPPAQVAFGHRPQPTWTFRRPDAWFERAVLLQRTGEGGQPALLLQWRNLGTTPLRLLVRPLLGWCDADHLPPVDERFDGTVSAEGASWGFRPDTFLPTLWLTVDGTAAFRREPAWYRDFLYEEDRARGYDHVGNRWSPGVLELDIPAGRAVTAAFSLGEVLPDPTAAWTSCASEATAGALAVAQAADPLRVRLERTADHFLYVAAGGRAGVLAGFPWFGEWGRDVFVSLPGLSLARGRLDLCTNVLAGALPFLRGGLLPNIYGRTVADSHYGSCDAALWFALCVQRYASAGADPDYVRETFVPALASIADAYFAGAELGLSVDASGLLLAGREDLNATWMDARTAAGPVTPRAGQPVEIQALWYSLLAFLAGRGQQRFVVPRDRCGDAFVRRFWLADGAYLADRLCDGVPDPSVRPNMVLAAALPLSPLTPAQRAAVVRKATAELLTPRGLRTLSPKDRAYRGRYEGGIEARDAAYHQGTAWPWLGGFHVEAALRAAAAATPQKQKKVRAELRAWLEGFLPELDRHGLDHVSEVFDGDPPQRPGGTFAQAWNTGELLRALALVDGRLRLDAEDRG